MEADRRIIEARAKALVRSRERQAGEPTVERILSILNFRPPKVRPRERLYGDRRTGMDYNTLYECSTELGELMDSWLVAQFRLDRWPLRQRLVDDLNRRKIDLYADRDGGVRYNFTRPAREEIDLGLGGPNWPSVGHRCDAVPGRAEAVRLFFEFIIGPFQRDVGRCKRCRKYFWNRWRHSDKVYCCSRCASADTAIRATRERRIKEQEDKLGRVERAIQKFEQLPAAKGSGSERDWKSWVRREAGLEVTLNFITRAINSGKVRPPKVRANTGPRLR